MKKILISVMALFGTLLVPAAAHASSYNGTTVMPNADGVTYNVTANSGDTVTLANACSVSGEQIAITFSGNVNGTVVTTTSTTLPAGTSSAPSGNVYTYCNVTLNGFTDASVSSAGWTFSVTQSWLHQVGLAASNIFLYHYNGTSWDRLSTTLTSSNTTTANFTASATALSPFAIVAAPGLVNTGASYGTVVLVATGAVVAVGTAFVVTRNKRKALQS